MMIHTTNCLRDLLPLPVVDRRLDYEHRKLVHQQQQLLDARSRGLSQIELLHELKSLQDEEQHRREYGEQVKAWVRSGETPARQRVRKGLAMIQPLLVEPALS